MQIMENFKTAFTNITEIVSLALRDIIHQPAQQQLATGWAVQGSNLGGWGEIFRTRPKRHWYQPRLLYNG
jgi:hypothetical protein